jgi:hypothetical protein
MLAQLRDVLAAENSTVVTQEHYDRGLLLPQRTEADGLAVAIRETDVGERCAEGIGHEQRPV